MNANPRAGGGSGRDGLMDDAATHQEMASNPFPDKGQDVNLSEISGIFDNGLSRTHLMNYSKVVPRA